MLIQRLGADILKGNYHQIIEQIKKNPGSCDEIWINSLYGWAPIETHYATAEKLSIVAEEFRKANIKVSLQISCSIGHGETMSSKDCSALNNPNSKVRHLVGYDGVVAGYAFCWDDDVFQKYILEEVRVYVDAIKPDCVWIDDDFRILNHGVVTYGCFCDCCIKKFNAENNYSYSRETLVEEFLHGDIDVRKKFIEFSRRNVGNLMYKISSLVRELSPTSYMGLQCAIQNPFEGNNIRYILDPMKNGSNKPPRVRYGGGVYDEDNPNNFIFKAFYINADKSTRPDYVTYDCPEIDNLPDVAFGKTAEATSLETSLYFARGAGHMSYAALDAHHESLDYYGKILSSFSVNRPYWNALTKANESSHDDGIFIPFAIKSHLRKLDKSENINDFNKNAGGRYLQLIKTGIPFAQEKQPDSVVYIDYDFVKYAAEEDIENILSSPAIVEASAIELLKQKGVRLDISVSPCSEETAFKIKEQFAEHPISAEFAGNYWNNYYYLVHFYRSKRYLINQLNNDLEIFSNYVNSITNETLGVSGAVMTTDKGAKWAVFGDTLNCSIINTAKREQILNAAEYVGGKPLGARLISALPSVLMPRQKNGKICTVSILNKSIGVSGPLQLLISNPIGNRFSYMSQHTAQMSIKAQRLSNDKFLLNLPSLPAWEVGSVFISE